MTEHAAAPTNLAPKEPHPSDIDVLYIAPWTAAGLGDRGTR